MDPKIPIAALVLLVVVAFPALMVDDSDVETLRIEAEAGSTEALFRYGVCLFEGDGVGRDRDLAITMWTEAAMRGHAQSAAALAGTFRARSSDATDLEEGQYWTARAADLGHQAAMLTLSGEALDRGDLVEAAVWVRLADRGNGRWSDRAGAIESRLDPEALREVDRRCGEWMVSHPTVSLVD